MMVTLVSLYFITIPVLEYNTGKNGQFRVNWLDCDADYSLPFTANIRKVWRSISIHTVTEWPFGSNK